MNTLLFLDTHEWVKIEDGIAYIGISSHAQDALGAIVFVELPKLGSTVMQRETFGAVESVKAASDLYSPISGKVVAVNDALLDEPERLNMDSYAHWIIKVNPSNLEELNTLLSKEDYEKSY